MSERLPEKHEPPPVAGGARPTVPANGGKPAFAPIADDFWPLLDAACADELTEEQAAALQTHLESNPAARREYIAHIRLRTNIRQWWKGERSRALGLGRIEAECDSPPTPTVVVNSPLPSHRAPLPALLSTDSVGGWAFSYIVASVFVCLLLLGFWAYKLPSDRGSSIASNENSRGLTANSRGLTAPGESPRDRPAPVFVGRVTGMAGAKWSDEPNYIAPLGVRVALGRTYKLKTGLMEITYDSGAKVILEGPCSYEVDSTAGGYLALGKLVARVGAGDVERGAGEAAGVKNDGGRMKDESGQPNAASLATRHSPLATNPSPLSPLPSPLFTVRTPTAVVTDLGTEFGVEVDDLGNTESHVFQGMVKLRMIGGSGQSEQAITIGVGQSVRCGRGEEKLVFVAERLPDRFVRRIEFNQTNKRIVETFDGDELNPAFEQIPLGKYINVNGTAVYHQTNVGHQSRGYIRTVSSNFCDRDFIFEATIRVEVNAPSRTPGSIHHVFFGIGDAVPKTDHYDTVSNGLVLDFVIDEGRAYVRLCHPITRIGISWDRNLDEFVPAGGFASGRHRFRMWKTGQRVGFEVEANLDQPTQKKYSSRPINLSLDIPPLLDASNSHLLIGTGNCDTVTVSFEDLSISYSQTPEERTAEKATKSRLPAAKSTQT